ncbi:MAG: class I SAM-dependent methyltransferase [Gammaproteobacteria bacterium]|nr:class I SAM-dependent methyltransferase [Gammaproteobacteria bacterium]
MKNDPELKIVESWKRNASPWIRAVRENEIDSRILVTNKAIVDAVLSQSPKKVLDIGCGEGWLVRTLSENGIDVLGVDVVSEFIESAKLYNVGRYQLLGYDQLSSHSLGEKFDVLVCNFSLFGLESVEGIFRSAKNLLQPGGSLTIQTLHPKTILAEKEAVEGWAEGSWSGFSSEFCDPAPWYRRSIGNWIELFIAFGFEEPEIIEPVNPKTENFASIVFIGKYAANKALHPTQKPRG